MTNKMVLYNSFVDRFHRRIIRLLWPYLILYVIMLTPILFYLNGSKPILLFWTFLMLGCIAIMFVSCHKWAKTKVTNISASSTHFEIEIIDKNKTTHFNIPIENIVTSAKWSGFRPKVLKLSLFDKQTKLIDLYSGGQEKEARQIENIKYIIDNHNSKA